MIKIKYHKALKKRAVSIKEHVYWSERLTIVTGLLASVDKYVYV